MSENNGADKAGNLAEGAGKGAGKLGRKAGKAAKKGANKATEAVRKLLKKALKAVPAILLGPLSILTLILIVVIIASMITNMMFISGIAGANANGNGTPTLSPRGTFHPRTKTPQIGKLSVNETGKHDEDYYFNSTNPFEASGYGMPNCTAYVWSRAYEMLDSEPNLCTGDAQDWYDYNVKYDYYPYGSEPRLGAIGVWSHPGSNGGESGHVAVVEKIEGTTITYSNSAYQSTFFFTNEVDYSIQTNFWDNSSWTFLGFIYIFDEIIYQGTSVLADVAIAEVEEGSHLGGQKYWSWYGFSSRVEWCACFTSYCMDKAGLLTEKAGGGHKDAQAATSWYKERDHFLSGGKTPSAGMLIFYDWDGDDSPDHIGIVIDVKNGTVHTAEGNHNDSTAFCEYAVADSRIYGYATFDTYDDYSGVLKDTSGLSDAEIKFIPEFYSYFKKKGYSKAAICGMLGNVFDECSMMPEVYFRAYNPDAAGAEGNSTGICMWYGDEVPYGNCYKFQRDCPNWNTSLQLQMDYLSRTLDKDGIGTDYDKYFYGCTGCKAAIQGVPNTKAGAIKAAVEFMRNYERPYEGYDQSNRWIKAAQYWELIN